MSRPICARCTRAARTVETPRVLVRVERSLVVKPHPLSAPDYYAVHVACHGERGTLLVEDLRDEADVENLSAFEKGHA